MSTLQKENFFHAFTQTKSIQKLSSQQGGLGTPPLIINPFNLQQDQGFFSVRAYTYEMS
jgi:hypothetical protein